MKSIILYTTRYGSVKKVAEMLKAKLSGEVEIVDLKMDKVPYLDKYDNVILAGSIYMGNIQKELKSYISAHLPELMKKKTGLFICAGSPDVESRVKELESSFPAELYVHAAAKDVLGYEIDFNKLGFLHKLITKAMKGNDKSISEFSEEKIEMFAKIMSAG